MSNRSQKAWIWAFIIIALVSAFSLGHKMGKRGQEVTIETRVDTLVIRDTITQYEPLFVEKKVVQKEFIPVIDTLRLRDTLFIALDREQVRWQDSLSVVYASGINPQVDSVTHFIQDRIITIETTRTIKEKSHWGVGVQAGMGVGKGGVSPYIGVGVSYNILTW